MAKRVKKSVQKSVLKSVPKSVLNRARSEAESVSDRRPPFMQTLCYSHSIAQLILKIRQWPKGSASLSTLVKRESI